MLCPTAANAAALSLPITAPVIALHARTCVQAAERSHERKVKRAKKKAREANLQKRMAIMQEKGRHSTPSEHSDES